MHFVCWILFLAVSVFAVLPFGHFSLPKLSAIPDLPLALPGLSALSGLPMALSGLYAVPSIPNPPPSFTIPSPMCVDASFALCYTLLSIIVTSLALLTLSASTKARPHAARTCTLCCIHAMFSLPGIV